MKSVVKKLVFHPCIVAVYIGLGLMIFQNPLNQIYSAVLGCGIPLLPELVKVLIGALDKGIRSAGGCTTAMTMVLIGMMFSGMSLRSMIDKNTMFISALRLVVMPAIVFAACHFTGIDPFPCRCMHHYHWHAGPEVPPQFLRRSMDATISLQPNALLFPPCFPWYPFQSGQCSWGK